MASIREIVYYDVSPFAALSASGTAENAAEFSSVPVLFREHQQFRSIQTCENNYTMLDGTFDTFADGENIALWGATQSDTARNLSPAVALEVRFGGLQSSPGIAFFFDRANNGFCDSLNIQWFRDGELLSDRDFQPTGVIYSCVHAVERYDRVIVTFRRLNMPLRFLRVEAVIFGIVRFFTDSELESLTLNEGTDSSGRTVYINSASFTINTAEPVPYLFIRRQPLHIRYKGEMIGVYYVDKSKKYADRRYSIEAVDMVGVLDSTGEFLGGVYNNVPAGTVIESIVNGLFDIEINAALRDIRLNGWIPICGRRDALAQVALAIGAVIDATRDGAIKVREATRDRTSIIDKSRVYTGNSVGVAFPYTSVELVEHNYTLSANTPLENLFEDTFAGEKMIKLSQPHSNFSITNGIIIEAGFNWVRISSTGSAVCLLRGRPYTDNQNSVIIKTPDLTEGTQERSLKIENGHLINRDISQAVAQRLYNYYQRRNIFNGDILLDTENMEKVADIVSVATGFWIDMPEITGQIEKLVFSPGVRNIKARGTIRGN